MHKLFKVLGPRFANRQSNFTQLHRVPGYEGVKNIAMAFLEYRSNPYPPLQPSKKKNPNWILNILIREAVKDIKRTGILPGAGNQLKTSSVPTNDESTELTGLKTALEDLQLGMSQEGAVDGKHVLKDGTPV